MTVLYPLFSKVRVSLRLRVKWLFVILVSRVSLLFLPWSLVDNPTKSQPRSQGLSSLPREEEKRDPGNEVGFLWDCR